MEEILREKSVINFLTDQNNYYLSKNRDILYEESPSIEPSDVVLYRIDEISFEDKAPRKEALENVLSSMRMDSINFIYMILGDSAGVHFYYGAARNYAKNEPELNLTDAGRYILKPGIRGNFRGSRVTEIRGPQKREVLAAIAGQNYYSMLEGVPGYVQDSENFQGADRLVDVMQGDKFGFMIIASPLNYEDLRQIENNLYDIYSRIVPLSKKNIQEGTSTNTGKSQSETDSKNKSSGTSHNKEVKDSNKTKGHNSTWGTGKSNGWQKSRGKSASTSVTTEHADRRVQDWLKYLDEVIIPRLDYGIGKGVFVTVSFLFSDSRACLKKLENTAISLYSGKTGNKIPLRADALENGDKRLGYLKNMQLPSGTFSNKMTSDELMAHSALSRFVSGNGHFSVGNWITTNELAMVAGLPQKDVVGLELTEAVEFGLNFKNDMKDENKIAIGKLVQSGNIVGSSVYLDKASLDKHIFITGVTGSGKTTTCQTILEKSGKPFLVIEPAKTEYRIMKEKYPDLLIFTPGKDTAGPFRLNPFEFFPHESITSRADMIQACIEASFDMEAAIPQIIESAIYACYEDYGWNISTNKNKYYGDKAFSAGVYAFPTLEDLVAKVEKVVDQQGFDLRLRNDYIGSIKARLQGLLAGAKGFTLNTKRSVDFQELLDCRVILELEEIRSATEKSLIMGFILINLMEAVRADYIRRCGDGEQNSQQDALHAAGQCRHITLVEEAHRLLGKYSPGDSPNKKHGVETFSDMLAEIRKYGECLMIADQIPNKLTPEILKNTNTKIVHRLFAEDDKEAIGNTIVLEKEQKEFLSKLDTGYAVVFTQGFNKAVLTHIEQSTDTASNTLIRESELRKTIYQFYIKHYKQGIIMGTQLFKKQPSLTSIQKVFDLNRNSDIRNLLSVYINSHKISPEYARELSEAVHALGTEFVAGFLIISYYSRHPLSRLNELIAEKRCIIEDFIDKCLNNNLAQKDYRTFYDSL